MKNGIILILIIILVAVAPGGLALIKAEEPPVNPAAMAGKLAAEAVAKGDLAAAQGWTDVQLKLEAARYVGPLGDLLTHFRGQIKNLPQFLQASAEAELSNQNISSRFMPPWDRLSMGAVMANDVQAYKLHSMKSAVWRSTIGGEIGDGKSLSKDPTQEELQAFKAWIDSGMEGDAPFTLPAATVAQYPQLKMKLRETIAGYVLGNEAKAAILNTQKP